MITSVYHWEKSSLRGVINAAMLCFLSSLAMVVLSFSTVDMKKASDSLPAMTKVMRWDEGSLRGTTRLKTRAEAIQPVFTFQAL